jgi:uncharacterized protein (TIGR00290 family)
MEKVLFSWSGGKDSALALFEILKERQFEVTALLTTVNRDYDRVSMHGVRSVLLEQQAASVGFPLEEVFISTKASNDDYEAAMREVLTKYQAIGISAVVFGDLFLEDIRRYREEKLAQLNMRPIFPLWGSDTRQLTHSLLTLGFKAVTTCVDTQALGQAFVGRSIDEQFLSDLPATVDPCGENGEFHSFVSDGPIFREPISYRIGEKVLRDARFYFCDLVPTELPSTRDDGAQ